jgi:hypothetical protein
MSLIYLRKKTYMSLIYLRKKEEKRNKSAQCACGTCGVFFMEALSAFPNST